MIDNFWFNWQKDLLRKKLASLDLWLPQDLDSAVDHWSRKLQQGATVEEIFDEVLGEVLDVCLGSYYEPI